MNEINWPRDMFNTDEMLPLQLMTVDIVYTLQLGDFLRMPDIDYKELALIDPHVHALFN